MSEVTQSILSQVKAEVQKAKRESVKANVKKLYSEYLTAQEVVSGIEQKIIAEVESLGETGDVIRNLLSE